MKPLRGQCSRHYHSLFPWRCQFAGGFLQGQTERKWKQLVSSVTVLPASPYDGTAAVLKKAAEIRPEETDLIVLDCIGYTMEMKEQIHQLTGKPVILPRTLTARVIRELGDA